ncbi:MAG TPA: 3-oxoacyl-ACP reductase FabG [Acetobacteraceae bacterium]
MRRALVTGGSGALGAAICRALAAAGHHVAIHANSGAARAEALAAEIGAAGGSAEVARFDVTDPASCEAGLGTVLAGGPVQILVNNAGIHDDAVMPGMRREQWARVIDVSLNGFFNVTQPLLLPMLRGRWGRIVSISSVSALLGNRGQANYAAAKAGLHGATRSLALELASRGVTVNAVAPGLIASPMAEAAFTAEQVAALVPMKRAGTPEEVAALVGFLCSDAAGYITGQVISVNGGMI